MSEIIFRRGEVYFKDKSCTKHYTDQETAAVLWQLKEAVAETEPYRALHGAGRRWTVGILLLLLLTFALGIVGVSVKLWWPDLLGRFAKPLPVPTASMPEAQAEQAMSDLLKSYSDRVSDLEKLISVLLGLSGIYTISLGLSSWASVQSSLQQAEKWIEAQQARLKDTRDAAEEQVEKIETLLLKHAEGVGKMEDALRYARAIPGASAALALAVQGKYVSDAELAIKTLVKLRTKQPTDRYINFYLGRLYKVLKRLRNAEESMTAFIQSKEAANERNDPDVGDAYYNRACYRALLWTAAKDTDKTKLQTEIAEDVRKFCAIDEKMKTDVATDTDFDAIRTQSRMVEALK
jgi:hypothetical protein